MIEEARLEPVESGLAPVTAGWFVVNARDAAWMNNDATQACCIFESDDFVLDGRPDLEEQTFAQLGFTLRVLMPGKPNGMYHAETDEEDFLVLSGECIAIVEGQERRMRQWDFLHSPPGTEHTTVGAGNEPCAILMVGTRSPEHAINYIVDAVAARYGASVEHATNSPAEAYAGRPPFRPAPAPPPFRPGPAPPPSAT